jgi:hypothetical protein
LTSASLVAWDRGRTPENRKETLPYDAYHRKFASST